MKKTCLLLISLFISFSSYSQKLSKKDFTTITEFFVGQELGLLRAVPVELGENKKGFLLVYSADKDIDPYIEMFYMPTDRVKFKLVDIKGNTIWKKTMGPCVLNSIWIVPVYPFDLDDNGVDEIYYVANTDSFHILSYNKLHLTALDAKSGDELGQWKWPRVEWGSLSYTFRNFILGGYVRGKPVLLTAQGTYSKMGIQAWDKGMKKRWELLIKESDPGVRGSHQTPVVDIDNDGTDELMWGERCINIDNGEYIFIADEQEYNGHSDVIQPTLDREKNKWYIFTCRESGDRGQIKPRVVMFDDSGNRVWTDLEQGHMDMRWTAHTGDGRKVAAYTISRGGKKAGPDGFFRLNVVEYNYNAWTGKRIKLPFKAYNTIPVNLNGDGIHEFACAYQEQSDRNIYDVKGNVIGSIGENGYVAMASKILDLPGEQLFCYYPDGKIKIWAMKNAKDNEMAKARYSNPFYKVNQKQTANGYNMVNLGGL